MYREKSFAYFVKQAVFIKSYCYWFVSHAINGISPYMCKYKANNTTMTSPVF